MIWLVHFSIDTDGLLECILMDCKFDIDIFTEYSHPLVCIGL